MSILWGLGARARGLFADNKGPWGPTGGNGDEPPSSEGGGGGPWGEPPKRGRRSSAPPPGNVASFEDFLRRSKARFGDGGGGGRFPGAPSRSLVAWAILGFVLLWLLVTSLHSIAPGQNGVVTRFGRYSSTIGPGVSFTLPSPIDRVTKIDVENIRSVELGSQSGTDLMLTADQNLLDIA